jgi:hypothetical protein
VQIILGKEGVMKRKTFLAVLVAAAALAAVLPIRAADHYRLVNDTRNFYYGHISYIEPTTEGRDPVILREGRPRPEPGLLNSPVGPGDTVRTSSDRRCEIQFDTGTIVRLDFDTEVKVETVLARSLSSAQQLSNLALVAGRIYVMYKEYDRREVFQILTPNAAVKIRHNAVSMIATAADGSSDVQVGLGRARVLFGADLARLQEQEVRKLERFVVLRSHQSQMASYIGDTDFELWNRDINARFDELHKGITALPKPIQRLPPAVFHFAQKFGNRYGEWLWDDYLGYVWRPYIDNMAYPWGWQPYYYGQWAYAGGQMFWIPEEPWGWVPYHLGIWHWSKKRGWVWMPGSMFAPAWVAWDFFFGYAAWRPWGLFDWMRDYGMPGFYYGGEGWLYHFPLPIDTIPGDRLTPVDPAPLPIPREFRPAVRTITKAALKRDPGIMDSLTEVPRHLVLVPKESLNAGAIHGKAKSWEEVPKPALIPSAKGGAAALRQPADPGLEAIRIFRGLESPRTLPERSASPWPRPDDARTAVAVSAPAVRSEAAPPGPAREPGDRGVRPAAPGEVMRLRDWNPDVKIARELGVRIEYSSRQNAVVCPELRLSSRDRSERPDFGPRLTSPGTADPSGGQLGLPSSGMASPPTGQAEAGRSSSGAERASEKASEKKTGGETIKK